MKAVAEIGHHGKDGYILTFIFNPAFGIGKGARGNIYRKVFDTQLATGKSAQQSAGFSRSASAELNDRNRSPRSLHNLFCRVLQNSELSPRRIILGQTR